MIRKIDVISNNLCINQLIIDLKLYFYQKSYIRNDYRLGQKCQTFYLWFRNSFHLIIGLNV